MNSGTNKFNQNSVEQPETDTSKFQPMTALE